MTRSSEEGQRFKEGTVLARLETDDYKADFDRAVSTLANAGKRLKELEKSTVLEIQQAEARLANTREIMEFRDRDASRILASGAGSSIRDRDEALSQRMQAHKSFEDAQATLRLLQEPRQQRIAALRDEVGQAEADRAKANGAWTSARSWPPSPAPSCPRRPRRATSSTRWPSISRPACAKWPTCATSKWT